MFYDIHTHHPTLSDDVVEIESCWLGQSVSTKARFQSIGLHPWHLEDYVPGRTRIQLEEAASNPQILAIGESGLDKMPSYPWQYQEAAFGDSVVVAGKLKKPLIIHAVRTYPEILTIFKWTPLKPPHIIFHGYNKHPQLAQTLLQSGAYLSFGAAILRQKNAMAALQSTPPARMLLETDDSSIAIEEIYERAAFLLGWRLNDVQDQMATNFFEVFGSFAT